MAQPGVQVTGLNELIRDARKVSREAPKEMRKQLLPISQLVLVKSRARASALGGVHRHAARRGLKAGATQKTAWIRLMATREPSILGAEFGGGARRTTRQFPLWRGSGRSAGYFMWPTIRDESDNIVRAAEAGVRKVLRAGGFR